MQNTIKIFIKNNFLTITYFQCYAKQVQVQFFLQSSCSSILQHPRQKDHLATSSMRSVDVGQRQDYLRWRTIVRWSSDNHDSSINHLEQKVHLDIYTSVANKLIGEYSACVVTRKFLTVTINAYDHRCNIRTNNDLSN